MAREFKAYVSTASEEDEAFAEAVNDLFDYVSQLLRTVRGCVSRRRVHINDVLG